jgi:hypothetical protein
LQQPALRLRVPLPVQVSRYAPCRQAFGPSGGQIGPVAP